MVGAANGSAHPKPKHCWTTERKNKEVKKRKEKKERRALEGERHSVCLQISLLEHTKARYTVAY